MIATAGIFRSYGKAAVISYELPRDIFLSCNAGNEICNLLHSCPWLKGLDILAAKPNQSSPHLGHLQSHCLPVSPLHYQCYHSIDIANVISLVFPPTVLSTSISTQHFPKKFLNSHHHHHHAALAEIACTTPFQYSLSFIAS